MAAESVWVIDDDQSIRWVLEKALEKAKMDVKSFSSASGILETLERGQPDALITDVRMPGMDGFELLGKIQQRFPELPVIIITAHSDLDSAVTAYQDGAFEYLPKPFDVQEAVELTQRAVDHSRSVKAGNTESINDDLPEIIGEAPAMQEVFRAIGRLSRSNITVLINGESGTGKELVARALHKHSPRADMPFVALNMAAIPKDLLESELFGHERGAFTGAQTQRVGRFEQSDGGTLFLDEIGDMPAEMQTRLLRVLSDGEFFRVGGHTPIKVNVRIVAATHQNLEQRVQEGSFREDLFHRLNVIRVHLPALRERREDIGILIRYFLQRAAVELSVDVKTLLPDAEAYLKQLDWPGNVRQVENLCRWLTVMASGQEIKVDDLPTELKQSSSVAESSSGSWESILRDWANRQFADGRGDLLDEALPVFERTMIEAALARTAGRRQDAARLLGWGRNTLTRKIKELDMEISK
ncbi:MAG: nitrogen regulation protein NR(I) [Gammaproteobacteria bacterium]|nr:nitrogen regulation protein NR(I) [Gammaproteobacteria bacterium]